MGLEDKIQWKDDLRSFEDDGYEMTDEMIEKYTKTVITIVNGQTRSRGEYFCKNASIFEVSGIKVAWGDISPKDVESMLWVYYILSEHKSYWDVDKEAVKKYNFKPQDPFSKSPFI